MREDGLFMCWGGVYDGALHLQRAGAGCRIEVSAGKGERMRDTVTNLGSRDLVGTIFCQKDVEELISYQSFRHRSTV